MQMAHDLSGKIAIVTGATRGYGRGIAKALTQAGANVCATGRTEQDLKALADEIGCHTFVADITISDQWDALFDYVNKTFGQLDILVNNAGAGINVSPLVDQTDSDLATSIQVNLIGAMYGCRRAAKTMGESKSGLIVNVSSVCAQYAYPGWAAYSAAKAGLEQFSRCLYAEMRPQGVRITNLTPSWGATDFVDAADIQGHPAGDPAIRDQCTKPEELGDVVAYLATVPSHLAVPEMLVLPMVQAIEPM